MAGGGALIAACYSNYVSYGSHELAEPAMTSTVTLISMGRYVIDVHAPEPSYLQLASQLRARIRVRGDRPT